MAGSTGQRPQSGHHVAGGSADPPRSFGGILSCSWPTPSLQAAPCAAAAYIPAPPATAADGDSWRRRPACQERQTKADRATNRIAAPLPHLPQCPLRGGHTEKMSARHRTLGLEDKRNVTFVPDASRQSGQHVMHPAVVCRYRAERLRCPWCRRRPGPSACAAPCGRPLPAASAA